MVNIRKRCDSFGKFSERRHFQEVHTASDIWSDNNGPATYVTISVTGGYEEITSIIGQIISLKSSCSKTQKLNIHKFAR